MWERCHTSEPSKGWQPEWVPQRTWVYRRRLHVPERRAPGDRTFLEFDGIDYAASIHLDGERIAAHEGTYVPLVVEVTDRLRRLLA